MLWLRRRWWWLIVAATQHTAGLGQLRARSVTRGCLPLPRRLPVVLGLLPGSGTTSWLVRWPRFRSKRREVGGAVQVASLGGLWRAGGDVGGRGLLRLGFRHERVGGRAHAHSREQLRRGSVSSPTSHFFPVSAGTNTPLYPHAIACSDRARGARGERRLLGAARAHTPCDTLRRAVHGGQEACKAGHSEGSLERWRF